MKKSNYFSASDLIKKSAAQILFLLNKRIEIAATYKQLQGNYHAEQITIQENASAEKRGVVTFEDIVVFFCIDMIKDNKYVEIKMVDDMENYPDWYLESSIMQSTLYASLLQDVTSLDTPTFRQKEGFKQEIVKKTDNPEFELWFGDDKYRIFPNDDIKLHYLKKASIIYTAIESSPLNFDSCRAFDIMYKFKEFSIFQPEFQKL